jgi:hypothetical protein
MGRDRLTDSQLNCLMDAEREDLRVYAVKQHLLHHARPRPEPAHWRWYGDTTVKSLLRRGYVAECDGDLGMRRFVATAEGRRAIERHYGATD